MKKLATILFIISIMYIFTGTVTAICFKYNTNDNKINDLSSKEVNEPIEKINYTINKYRCYKSKNQISSINTTNYEYTEYYEFEEAENSILNIHNKVVYIYKLSNIDDYNNFDISSLTNEKDITKDEENYTYIVLINTSLTTKDIAYNLEEYFTFLNSNGYGDCELISESN